MRTGCWGGAEICEVPDVLTNVEFERGCELDNGTWVGDKGNEGEVAVVTCVEHEVFDGDMADEVVGA